MATDILLNVELRERTGKGGSRQARRENRVPAILYGGKEAPVSISLDRIEILKALNTGKFLSNLVEIEHKGKKQFVIPQDVQFHPVTEVALHVDLYRVKEDQLVKVEVPVHFTGEDVSPGIKRGGSLNIVRHTVELEVPAGHIPEFLTGDVSSLDIGDNVKISNIELPKDATPTITDRDFTIATIVGRTASAKADDAEDDAAEEEGEAEA
ncbi:50S ribosomal protein L25/general stress protein Ctc [Hirschia baltica]|uniref:Large ribosomal subunit protein bL25 n=1 Tax=Hirschia baltica (strain ATCC 49814 / DSM 5838 / IFAM 1418) TaxID=582402 RepID=C6XPH0_HIRBI|nr:50S ribosomal protein L25/general stress protein Ctc [Hirschia baltica]ACT58456.1 ribosomal 5S rRNA E-loop binding protein Ctc/L25/TL5 [Hirschia baltica ATCC 49814]